MDTVEFESTLLKNKLDSGPVEIEDTWITQLLERKKLNHDEYNKFSFT